MNKSYQPPATMGVMTDHLLRFMQRNNLKPEDVQFVKHESGTCTFAQLLEAAKDIGADYVTYEGIKPFKVQGDSWVIWFDRCYGDLYYSKWKIARFDKSDDIFTVPTIHDLMMEKCDGCEEEDGSC